MNYTVCTNDEINEVVNLALLLWPENNYETLEKEFGEIINSESEDVYFAKSKDDYIGFVHVACKSDYVNGAKTSPVGYIEGIFIKDEFRNQGIAKKLIRLSEKWSKEKGCTEMGSDVLIDNPSSMKFHEKVGFKEVERVVCYIKAIK